MGSGESVLAIFGCDGFENVDREWMVEVEVMVADNLQPRNSFSSIPITMFHASFNVINE